MNDNPQDQDLLKLIKQSKRKKRLLNIFSPLIVTFLFLLITGTLFLNYFNLGPFTGDKIAGVPDNHLRMEQTTSPFNKLLFDNSNAYQFNYYGTRVELWLAHYQNGQKMKETQIGPIIVHDSPTEKHQIAGSLAYGLNQKSEKEQDNAALSFYFEMNGASTSDKINLADYAFEDITGYSFGIRGATDSQTIYSKNSHTITKDVTYDLITLISEGPFYQTTERKEQFKDNPNGLVLYLVFK